MDLINLNLEGRKEGKWEEGLVRDTALNSRQFVSFFSYFFTFGARGGVVVKALPYKPAGRGFDSRWCQWDFSLT